jgi:predicted DNA-binding protein YlxM (UPF0122 family)
MSRPSRTHRRTLDRFALGLIAVMMLPAGLQAAFAPQSFFDDFPFGRGWISHQADAYNEHLVRDVGALLLTMIVVNCWTVLRRGPTSPIAAAWLLLGLLHLNYHAAHLHGYSTTDRIGLVASLVAVPALAACALWTARANMPDGLTPSPQSGGPTDALVDAELIELRDALTGLSSRQRSAIVLHYLCDLPDEEIAAYLKCRRSTVRALMQHGLAELRYVNSATTMFGDEMIDTERLLRQRLAELADRAPTAVRLRR